MAPKIDKENIYLYLSSPVIALISLCLSSLSVRKFEIVNFVNEVLSLLGDLNFFQLLRPRHHVVSKLSFGVAFHVVQEVFSGWWQGFFEISVGLFLGGVA